jgi:hypothetical protein
LNWVLLIHSNVHNRISPSDLRDQLLRLNDLGLVLAPGVRGLTDKAVTRCSYRWA